MMSKSTTTVGIKQFKAALTWMAKAAEDRMKYGKGAWKKVETGGRGNSFTGETKRHLFSQTYASFTLQSLTDSKKMARIQLTGDDLFGFGDVMGDW